MINFSHVFSSSYNILYGLLSGYYPDNIDVAEDNLYVCQLLELNAIEVNRNSIIARFFLKEFLDIIIKKNHIY
jgi:hypothetical protein